VDEDVKTELREAAETYRNAPKVLKDAIIKAARSGHTAAEIASTIDLTYSPDYVSQIIREAGVPRARGRRPRTPRETD
jgi:hypothetical protein